MEFNYAKIVETLVVIVLYLALRNLSFRLVNRTMAERLVPKPRGMAMKKITNLTFTLVALILIILIWGVNHSDLAIFVGSVLTVIGVAMFAQWSLLSNITSSVIIFFNHSVKAGDEIEIMEAKDYAIEGIVLNIGLFFASLQTADGEELTLPNNVFIQKLIKKKKPARSEE